MLSDTVKKNMPFIIKYASPIAPSPPSLERATSFLSRRLVAPQISESVGAHHSAGWVRMTSETPW